MENKNQKNRSSGPTTVNDTIVVKDYDGRFKVLSQGELKELDDLLTSTEAVKPTHAVEAQNKITDLSFPKFTDVAKVPDEPHFKEPEKKAEQGEKVDLHFHPDDQDEIQKEIKKINEIFQLSPQKQYSIHKISLKLLEKHGLKLSESEEGTATRLLLSYFRQARSARQTREIFVAPKAQGGLGLAGETVDHLLPIASHLKQKIEETDGIVVEKDSLATPNVTQQQISPKAQKKVDEGMPRISMKSEIKSKQIAKPAEGKPRDQAKVAPVAAPQPVQRSPIPKATDAPKIVSPMFGKQQPTQEVVQPNIDQKQQEKAEPVRLVKELWPEKDQEEERGVSEQMPKVVRPTPKSTRVSASEDVKRPVPVWQSGKPMGRLDELSSMDLSTWRMLDEDPRVRAGKILGKLQNLEQDSFTRKSQGIQAWRSNRVYQLYLSLGQQSLEQKKDVADVITETEARGEETLALDEFEAISDLNRALRY